jgi:hypothetical protein
MRALAFVSVALAIAAGGCTGYGELRSIVGAATPDGAERVGKCQEFGVYGVIDDAAYGCVFFVPGTRDGVALDVAKRLVANGFTARCGEESQGTIAFHGERGGIRVSGQVSRRGSVITMSGDQALNISRDPPTVSGLDFRRAPARNVILDVGASHTDGPRLWTDWPDCVPFLRARR